MKVAVIGSGGREHAICYKLKQSPKIKKLFCIPGNAGTQEIAENSPLGVVETRATMRQGLADRVRKATDHELVVQNKLRATEDFKEGIRAVAERRVPSFKGL